MTQRKRNLTPSEMYQLSYYTPWVVIIRRKGFFWVHEKTVIEMGELFHDIINAHNIIIKGYNNQLNIYKLIINNANQN